MDGEAMAMRERKESCLHELVSIPTNPFIRDVMKIYLGEFRPFLVKASAKGKSVKNSDIEHVNNYLAKTPLDTTLIAMFKAFGHQSRLPSRYNYIMRCERPTPEGWATKGLTDKMLRVAWNGSDYNTSLFVDHKGDPHPTVGQAIVTIMNNHGGSLSQFGKVTLTKYRKLVQTSYLRKSMKINSGKNEEKVDSGQANSTCQDIVHFALDHTVV